MQLVVYGSELLFAEALASLLSRRGHTIIACPTSLAGLLEVVDSVPIDVCLVDVSTAADAVAVSQIKASRSDAPVIVLNSEADPSLLSGALESGADGVCLKVDGIEEIERILLLTRDGEGSSNRRFMWSRGANASAKRRTLVPRGVALTPKEKAVLQLLIPGTSTSKIAEQLGIGEATVRTHLQHLFGKFGVHSRIALIAAAVHGDRTRAHATSDNSMMARVNDR